MRPLKVTTQGSFAKGQPSRDVSLTRHRFCKEQMGFSKAGVNMKRNCITIASYDLAPQCDLSLGKLPGEDPFTIAITIHKPKHMFDNESEEDHRIRGLRAYRAPFPRTGKSA